MLSNGQVQDLKKCVTFIYGITKTGEWTPLGTGFFVGINLPPDQSRVAVYLVTARHVLQDAEGVLLRKILVRLNSKSGGAASAELDLSNALVYQHHDLDVDLIVIRCSPNQDSLDFRFVGEEMLCTTEMFTQMQIRESDDVLFTGLFTGYIGQSKIQPILRFGKIALISDEKIGWREKNKPPQQLDLYLIECQSFGGNSGSPVFFYKGPTRNPGVISFDQQIGLIGVVKGSFLQGSEIQVISSDTKSFSIENVGISAVIPAQKLHEILFSLEASNHRSSITNGK